MRPTSMFVQRWLERPSRVLKVAEDPLSAFPNVQRLFQTVNARPAVARAKAVGKGHACKKVDDDETNLHATRVTT